MKKLMFCLVFVSLSQVSFGKGRDLPLKLTYRCSQVIGLDGEKVLLSITNVPKKSSVLTISDFNGNLILKHTRGVFANRKAIDIERGGQMYTGPNRFELYAYGGKPGTLIAGFLATAKIDGVKTLIGTPTRHTGCMQVRTR